MSCATNLQKMTKAGQRNGIPTRNTYLGNLAQTSPLRPQTKLGRMAVIAPDRPSGQAYYKMLRAGKVRADLRVVSIAPRVLGNRMNGSPKVAQALAAAIMSAHEAGYNDLSLACNTLQLWKERALALTPCIAPQVNILTTFEAMKKKFPEPQSRPVWLGTTVTCRRINPFEFQTLVSRKLPEAQALTQEIIWRTKATCGADVSTSGLTHLPDLRSPAHLQEKVLELVEILKRNNIRHVALGCTELPLAFGMVEHGLRTEDPAQAIAEMARGPT